MMLVFLLDGTTAWAQATEQKKAVYTAFLRRYIAIEDSLSHHKFTSVVVLPTNKNVHSSVANISLLKSITPVVPEWQKALPKQVPEANEKAVLGGMPPPVGPAAIRPHSKLLDWVSADSGLTRMVRRYDALDQNVILPSPIDVPGCVVKFESLDFLRSIKWDWKGFYRKNQNSLGVVQLSDMAFSDDGRYAVFYFSNTRGYLNGAGYYVFMENSEQGWQTKFVNMIWIS